MIIFFNNKLEELKKKKKFNKNFKGKTKKKNKI